MRASQIVLGVVLMHLVSPAWATGYLYPFPIREATSANGRYVADGKRLRECTLYDGVLKREIWARKVARGDGIIVSLCVTDTGRTLMCVGSHRSARLTVVDPEGGDVGRIDVFKDVLTDHEKAEYVRRTTAGDIWSDKSLWYCTAAEGREFFVVRLGWDRRIVVDAVQGNLVDMDGALERLLTGVEEGYVLETLRKGVGDKKAWEQKDASDPTRHGVLLAAYLAGKLKVQEAIPLLRQLEDSSVVGGRRRGGTHEKPEGEVDLVECDWFVVRTIVHLSLRRLGQKPVLHACTRFRVHFSDKAKEYWCTPAIPGAPRDRNARSVTPGLKAEQVFALIGAPDFVSGDDLWDYEIDTKNPYTLIVRWEQSRVAGTERISPPLWMGECRDKMISF